MFFLIMLLLGFFFFPYLLLPFFLFFLLLIFLLPFKFTFDSFLHLFTVPSQIYQIATNPSLRKNHGLEHATVNVLEKEYGYKNIAGFAEESGFYIIGADSKWVVEEAAARGLELMKRGNYGLAIHKRCGTSMTVANFISAVIFLLLLFYTGYFSIFNMVIAIILANLTGPYLGQIIQKYFTTSTDIGGMEIVSTAYAERKHWNAPPRFFVRTREIPFINS